MTALFDIPPDPPGSGKHDGTAGTCGHGPEGETCRTCLHFVRKRYGNYVHLKCGLMRHHWTHGEGSDIRAKWPACEYWAQG